MTTQADARSSLIQRVRKGLNDLPRQKRIPLALDNQEFDSSGEEIWVELGIESTASFQRTLGKPGNRKYRREGVLSATIRVRPGIGVEKPLDVAEKIRDTLEGKSVDGVQPFGGVLVQEQGRDITGYNVLVTFPFWFEERG